MSFGGPRRDSLPLQPPATDAVYTLAGGERRGERRRRRRERLTDGLPRRSAGLGALGALGAAAARGGSRRRRGAVRGAEERRSAPVPSMMSGFI